MSEDKGFQLNRYDNITDFDIKPWLEDNLLALMPTDPLYETLEQVINVNRGYQRQPFVLEDITKKYKDLYDVLRLQTYDQDMREIKGTIFRRALNKYITRKFFIVTGQKITLGSDQLDDKLFEKDLIEIYGRGGKKIRRQTGKRRRLKNKSKRKQTRRSK